MIAEVTETGMEGRLQKSLKYIPRDRVQSGKEVGGEKDSGTMTRKAGGPGKSGQFVKVEARGETP